MLKLSIEPSNSTCIVETLPGKLDIKRQSPSISHVVNNVSFMFQDGSFVVIEQDSCIMPFTPYTVMVVDNGQLIKIPVVKNKSKQGKCRYSLAGIGSPKAVNMNCYTVYESLVIVSGSFYFLRTTF